VLNAAVAVHHLAGGRAEQSLVVSTLGGPAHEPIEAEFAALGIRRRWVRTASPTRVCTTVIERSNKNTATELIENAGPVTAAEYAEFESAFAEAAADARAVLLIGSLPKEAPSDFFQKLLEHVQCPAVLDIRGPELLAALKSRPAVIKPNRAELAQTLGAVVETDEELHDAVRAVMRRGARAVVVTSGGGEVWIAEGSEIHRVKPPPVETIVNPIGCGDCVAAGIAWGLASGHGLAAAVSAGLDAAA
jgi:fructose-1-phosphate kinase PfkB-like protein